MDDAASIEQFFTGLARDSWQLFREHALTFVLASVLTSLLGALSLGLLAGPLIVGMFSLVRRARQGEAVRVEQLFERFDSFVPSAIALLLVALAAGVGFLLLVLPGVLVLLFASYALQAIAYERLQAVAALKRSVAIARAHFLTTLLLAAAMSVLQSVGGSVVFGLLLSTPLSFIASALAYERLAASAPDEPALAPPPHAPT
jgi:uncharacterized membrane protein